MNIPHLFGTLGTRSILTIFFLFIVSFDLASGQNNNLTWLNSPTAPNRKQLAEAKKKISETVDRTPIKYKYVDDRDIFWSKDVWEIIDLNQKINFKYYYPTDTSNIDINRRSLFDVLTNGMRKGLVKEIYADEYLNARRTPREIFETMVRVDTTDLGIQQYNSGEPVDPQYVRVTRISSRDVSYYKIRGQWYFDKRNGEMKFRLMAICPVAPDVNEKDAQDPDLVEMFWVYYPDIREVLHNTEVFNENNTSNPLTYDHLLNTRHFASSIYKEKNQYEDRGISDYVRENALFQLEEAGRIKESIRDFESDLWSY